jgi:hypothetical protein
MKKKGRRRLARSSRVHSEATPPAVTSSMRHPVTKLREATRTRGLGPLAVQGGRVATAQPLGYYFFFWRRRSQRLLS